MPFLVPQFGRAVLRSSWLLRQGPALEDYGWLDVLGAQPFDSSSRSVDWCIFRLDTINNWDSSLVRSFFNEMCGGPLRRFANVFLLHLVK